MLNRIRNIIIAAILLLTAGSAFAQPSFKVNAPAVVAGGEVFSVSFTANSEVESFQGPAISGASVLAGPTKSFMHSTQIINGRRTTSNEVSYNYVLLAGESGQITIGPAKATIDGSTYVTKQQNVEIAGGAAATSDEGYGEADRQAERAQSSDDSGVSYGKADIFMRLSFNKNRVVKGEPLVATLKIYTRNDILGFEDIHFPIFNGFWSQEIETPQNITFVNEKVGDRIYSSAVLRKYMLIPQQTGDISVDPAELVVAVRVVNRQRRSRSFFDDFFDSDTSTQMKKRLTTGSQTIKVAALPADAPESFGGGVGKFGMNVRLTKDSVKSNEAASVVVEISGTGNLNLIEAPKVTFPNDFERYDVKTTNSFSNGAAGVSGKKTFEFPFIPRSEGDYTIPEISYSYFDTAQNRYVTLTNAHVNLRVSRGNAGSATTYVPSSDQRKVSNIDEDIRYITSSSPDLREKGKSLVGSWLFYFLAALSVAVYFIVRFLLVRRIALLGDVMRTRNRRASKVVRSRLRLAGSFLHQNKVQEFYEELHKALLGYVSDKLSIQFADMQRDTIGETLRAKGADEESIAGFLSLLEDCEMVRYSPDGAAGAMDAQYGKAADIISAFENKL